MRALMQSEVGQVVGGSPLVILSGIVGAGTGASFYLGYAGTTGTFTWGNLGYSAAAGAAVGVAAAASPVLAAVALGGGVAYLSGRYASCGFGNGMGGGFMGPGASGPRSQACTGRGGGSW